VMALSARLAISTASRNAAAAFRFFRTVAQGGTIYARACAFQQAAEKLLAQAEGLRHKPGKSLILRVA